MTKPTTTVTDEKWREEFDRLAENDWVLEYTTFDDYGANKETQELAYFWGDVPEKIKDFIQQLLDRTRAEVREEIKNKPEVYIHYGNHLERYE
jgi:NH3-dependent NAD+ synthetase